MKNCHIVIWSFVFLLVCSVALGQSTVIRAGHLIDPADGSITDNQMVLISEGKITEVGSHVHVSDSVQVVDLSGCWVMPGLMDAHTHLTLNFSPNSFDLGSIYLQESTALRALRGMHNARILLKAGFTTVKDIGNDANYAAADIRRAIERSWFVGPTIINSGKIIAPFGGQTANMSPEQGRGDPVDHRTDIWSMGVVLYEMFTGKLPFRGERDPAIVHSILNDEPKPLRQISPDIPPELEKIILRALEKNPDSRYHSLHEVAEKFKALRASKGC